MLPFCMYVFFLLALTEFHEYWFWHKGLLKRIYYTYMKVQQRFDNFQYSWNLLVEEAWNMVILAHHALSWRWTTHWRKSDIDKKSILRQNLSEANVWFIGKCLEALIFLRYSVSVPTNRVHWVQSEKSIKVFREVQLFRYLPGNHSNPHSTVLYATKIFHRYFSSLEFYCDQ